MPPSSDAPRFTESDLALIVQVAEALHQIVELEPMLQHVLDRITSACDIEGASLALHDPERREFLFLRTVENPGERIRQTMERMHFPDDQGVAGWVLRHGRSAVLQNVAQDRRFCDRMDQQGAFQTRSMICVPLKTPTETIGVLYALNRRCGAFSDKEARLLEIVAAPISAAIENARRYGALRRYASDLEAENRRLQSAVGARFALQGVVGASPAMQRVFDLLDKILTSPTTVLIQGETGTGKELIARVIHHNGPLRDRPFVAENCGAIAESLLESELFGHVRGAFTGATADKQGLFEMAGGGTVFLDEIADMPKSMQIKLLRVLQEGQVRPVGASRFVPVRFRLLTSSNRDLQELVRRGDFRQDLFYRIHVFPIVLPPLRERREDIPLLAAHFLEAHSRRLQRPAPRMSPEVLDRLTAYDWPGNVRELVNEMERIICLAGAEQRISVDCLSETIRQTDIPAAEPLDAPRNLAEAVSQVEKRMIAAALRESAGNRSRAARQLGLTRQGLLNKVARYGLAG
jgi:Nif-specific regulatory protein